MHILANYTDISPIISEIFRYQPPEYFCLLSFLCQTSYEITIKPKKIVQIVVQNSLAIEKKLNLKNQKNLLVKTFLVHKLRAKLFPDMLFLQNDGPV